MYSASWTGIEQPEYAQQASADVQACQLQALSISCSSSLFHTVQQDSGALCVPCPPLQQKKMQESSRYQTMVESISKMEKSFEVSSSCLRECRHSVVSQQTTGRQATAKYPTGWN